MREHNVICDNCRVEIPEGEVFISMTTAYKCGFKIYPLYKEYDIHFCHGKCVTEYIQKCTDDDKVPFAGCCSSHAGGHEECEVLCEDSI